MATSAARPNFQHYTAGSCTLEVEVQPSALSQWSARAIAKDLSFQLWLQAEGRDVNAAIDQTDAEAGDSRQLIAAGDRIALQELAQYFQQQTRRVLAVSTVNNRQRSAAAAPLPQSLQLTAPLGYLQLCDITTVMGQYEQMTRTLPVALGAVALEDVVVDSVPTTETTHEVVRAAPLENSNVIPFSAARRQRELGTEHRQRARRKRTGVWASSAAAALFAVGLTTTLLSRDPSLQETNIASDAVPEAQQETQQEGFALEEIKPQAAASSPSPSSVEDSEVAALESDEASEGAVPSDSTAERNVQIDPPVASGTGSPRQPTVATNPPRRPAARAPIADSDVDTTNLPERQSPEVSRGTSTSERAPTAAAQSPSPSPASPAPSASASSDAEGARSRLPGNGNTARRQPSPSQSQPEAIQPEATQSEAIQSEAIQSESVERESPNEALRGPDVPAADAPATDTPNTHNSDLASRTTPRTPSVERATPEPFSLPSDQQPSPTVGGDSSRDILTPPPSDRPSEALSGSIIPNPAIIAINQVQTYFQQRWQASDTELLTYRLQLNAAGEVVSFIGLDDISQAARDRILPTAMLPVFEFSAPLEESLLLRVQLKPDGTVEVTPF